MTLPSDSYEPEAFEPYGDEHQYEIEPTHAVADHHGFELASTPLDTLFQAEALGFDTAGAMYNG